MGANPKTVGGGPATGLANDFVGFLDSGLKTGNFGNPGQAFNGANPIGSTGGIASVLNTILSSGAGTFGKDLQSLITSQNQRDIGDLRARYGMGGNALGTPGANAESLYRAQAAPRAALEIGQLQLSALGPLMQMMAGLSSRGIPQAETVMQPNTALSILSALPGLGNAFANIKKTFQPTPTSGGGGGGGGTFGVDSGGGDSGSSDILAMLSNPDVMAALAGGMA